MRSFAILGLAGVALAGGEWSKPKGTGVSWVTDVVTSYTTYCPGPTKITHSDVTYTVTEATTLTITNCPCTITRPVESSTWVAASSAVPPPPPASSAPAKASSYFPSMPAPSSAAPVASATYTGAANKAQVAGAGLLALVGAAAVAL